jgi:hypothetical protein
LAPLIVDSQAKLVSPADGATGVPVTVGTVVFSYQNAALSGGTVQLTPSSPPGSQPVTGTVQGAGPGQAQATIGDLQPATTYTVRATSSARFGPCGVPVIGNLGSFTTR